MSDTGGRQVGRRAVLVGVAATPVAAALAWSTPVVQKAVALPLAVTSGPPTPEFNFTVVFEDFSVVVPTSWSGFGVTSDGTLPRRAVVTYTGPDPFVPAAQKDAPYLLTLWGGSGAARTGTSPDGWPQTHVDTANVKVNGIVRSSLLKLLYPEESSYYHAWQETILPGDVIELPLAYGFDAPWSPDLWYPGSSSPLGSLSFAVLSQVTDAVSTDNRADATVNTEIVSVPPGWG
ncbi:hypothetical protein [Microbacterium sp. 8M]|uniref:hypothetical protein n=1 Tax=Microbacterium sp. 8M TaxID=2653153 RepID=UPI001356D18E|nr:hypothetical protein [Microbacterium sp. 8M]